MASTGKISIDGASGVPLPHTWTLRREHAWATMAQRSETHDPTQDAVVGMAAVTLQDHLRRTRTVQSYLVSWFTGNIWLAASSGAGSLSVSTRRLAASTFGAMSTVSVHAALAEASTPVDVFTDALLRALAHLRRRGFVVDVASDPDTVRVLWWSVGKKNAGSPAQVANPEADAVAALWRTEGFGE
jgi:hypothetical protein